MKYIIFFIAFYLMSTIIYGQEIDSLAHSNKENTIRWNNTPMFVMGAKILEKYIPGGSLILDGQEINASGKLAFNYVGFRYLIQIGYRF